MSADNPARRALISVSDKTGVVDFAARLAKAGVELISTGGTARALREAGLEVRDVSEITGFPEMMDGRVKTLHPRIHGGLLALRDNEDHVRAMEAHGVGGIDLLAVNLYPFEETLRGGGDFAACIENIDIGGPAMIRAAAKNHRFVGVVTDPDDYDAVAGEIEAAGVLGEATRRRLAAKAYAKTAAYDAAISGWLAGETGETFPRHFALAGRLSSELRYGENPHQQAAFYASGEARPGVASARQVQGKALSYNNLNDTDAAYELVAEFDPARPAVAIIKHANPCGVAVADDLETAYARALRCDPVSAFGGIVALNRKLAGGVAEKIVEIFTEVVIAPDADEAAIEVFARKKNLRLLIAGGLPSPTQTGRLVRPIAGGFLLQDRDAGTIGRDDLKVVTKRRGRRVAGDARQGLGRRFRRILSVCGRPARRRGGGRDRGDPAGRIDPRRGGDRRRRRGGARHGVYRRAAFPALGGFQAGAAALLFQKRVLHVPGPADGDVAAGLDHRALDEGRVRLHEGERFFLVHAGLVFVAEAPPRGRARVEKRLPPGGFRPFCEIRPCDAVDAHVVKIRLAACVFQGLQRLAAGVAVFQSKEFHGACRFYVLSLRPAG